MDKVKAQENGNCAFCLKQEIRYIKYTTKYLTSKVICHCKTVSTDDVPKTLKLNAGTSSIRIVKLSVLQNGWPAIGETK